MDLERYNESKRRSFTIVHLNGTTNVQTFPVRVPSDFFESTGNDLKGNSFVVCLSMVPVFPARQ